MFLLYLNNTDISFKNIFLLYFTDQNLLMVVYVEEKSIIRNVTHQRK